MFRPDFKEFRIRSGGMRMTFSEVFKTALTKRLHPYTGLRKDDLCYALGVHGMTVRSWMRGENAPSGPMVAAVIDFFARRGDPQFLQDLFPDAVTPLIQRKREDDEAAAVGYAIKKLMQGSIAA